MRFKSVLFAILFAALIGSAHAQAPSIIGNTPVPNPIGVRTPQSVPPKAIAMPAGQSVLLSLLNPTRKSIQILNINTSFCTASSFSAAGTGGTVPTTPGQNSATSNTVVAPGTVTGLVGYPLEAASAAGHQGGSTPIYDAASTSTDEWDGICVAAGTLLVFEGN
jgi:hypothetical protein